MKKMIILAMMMTIAISASAMRYSEARSEALFLSDKMAYELGLNSQQYAAVYEINLDYLMSIGDRRDAFGSWWKRRNADLRYVLSPWQYDRYIRLSYFYRPVAWHKGTWTFHIYNRYSHRDRYFFARPSVYVSYKGGNNRRPRDFYATWAQKHRHHDNGWHKGWDKKHGKDWDKRHGKDWDRRHGKDWDKRHGKDWDKKHGKDWDKKHGKDWDKRHGKDWDRRHDGRRPGSNRPR